MFFVHKMTSIDTGSGTIKAITQRPGLVHTATSTEEKKWKQPTSDCQKQSTFESSEQSSPQQIVGVVEEFHLPSENN